ncbi:phosphoglycerate kinase [Candidatus Saccharibacteria bacterium]|nr:phosphoglycerate kinase [Candidatus Saccharibacteria bacterium]
MKTIKDIDIKDKVILLRADYNVPMQNGEVTSDLRIRASLPTLNYLRDHGAKKIVIISHLGRPNGIDPALSLKPVADILNDFLGRVQFVNDVAGPTVTATVAKMHPGDILLLENLRFYPGEKQNDPAFIKSIVDSVKPDFYVQDGFAVTHRAHASTVAVKDFLPVYAGLLVDYEVTNLKQAVENPTRPLTLILGGSKVADKKPLIDAFLEKADHILIGGKIAADGYTTTSPNVTIATDFDTDGAGAKQDIGPVSTADFANVITDSATIIWNGLLGHAEDPAYATSSTIVAELLGEAKDKTTIICGGDTTGFVEHLMNEHDSLSYTLISTGGGAALEFISGHPMPGLEAITA